MINRRQGMIGTFIRNIIILFWIAIVILPIIWILFNSIKDSGSILTDPWELPIPPKFVNFVNAWGEAGLGYGFRNSLIVTSISIVTIVGVSSLAAYVFARMNFRFKKVLYYFFIAGLMFPTFIAMAPLFILVNKLGLTNSLFGLILVYTSYSLAFTIFILTPFFKSIPKSIEEAAIIDGCGPFQVFFKVMLPLAKPGLISAAIFNFVGIWNEYVIGLILVTDTEMKTLPVALGNLMMVIQYRTDFGALYAGIIMSIIPVIIIYLIFQTQLMAGTTSGAVKE